MRSRYSMFMIVLHWTTALLVVGAYVVSKDAREVRVEPPTLHFAFGLSVITANLLLLLAGLHAALGLWHHFVRGDGTLGRMSPFRRNALGVAGAPQGARQS
jgi:cytochrome b561